MAESKGAEEIGAEVLIIRGCSMKKLIVVLSVTALVGCGLFLVLSCGGGGGGGGGAADGPKVTGTAFFYDLNGNGQADSGDQIIVSFDEDITVAGAALDDLELTEASDTLGTGGSVAAGSGSDEVSITLGDSPTLKTRPTVGLE